MVNRSAVVLFCKFPEPGQVKTRLTLNGKVSPEDAAVLAEAMFKDTLRLSIKGYADAIIIGFSPEERLESFREIVKNVWRDFDNTNILPVHYLVQRGIDFDERFGSIAQQSFDMGFSELMILGTDLPYLPPEIIQDSIQILQQSPEEHQIVLGPAGSGGIYLVGINRTFLPQWFSNYNLFRGGIELRQFIQMSQEKDLKFHLLPPYYDVDLLDDLISLIISIEALENASSSAGYYFPKYLARAVKDLGLSVFLGESHNRDRRLQKS